MTTSSKTRGWTIRTGADIGRTVAGVRAEKGLTQQQLANLACIDRTYLARLEAGASVLFVERALRALRRMGAQITVTLPAQPGASSSDSDLK